jgi:outer membrane protein OmpA-like peptidoglycan-associated protein
MKNPPRSRRRVAPEALVSLLGSLLLVACQATLSGRASVQGDGRGSTKGRAQVQGSTSVTVDGISFHDGQLDYTGTIRFAYDQATLEGKETFAVLEHLRDFLKKYPKVRIRVEGHTDSRGSEAHNKQLSRRRAEALKRWLAGHGIQEERMEAVGDGEDSADHHESPECLNKLPRDPATCEEQWARSRRAVFAVTEGAKTISPEEPRDKVVEKAGTEESTPGGERRRWALGAHLGGAESDAGGATNTHIFFGPDLGLWLSERWLLGLTGDLASGASGRVLGRGLLWIEGHTSAGPGPEFWMGAGLGAGTIPPRGSGSASEALALRLGVDWHASRSTRLGLFLEGAARDGGSWGGLGARLAFDFFGPR